MMQGGCQAEEQLQSWNWLSYYFFPFFFFFYELMFLDSSKDSGPAGEDVLLFYWAQSETRDFRKQICFF